MECCCIIGARGHGICRLEAGCRITLDIHVLGNMLLHSVMQYLTGLCHRKLHADVNLVCGNVSFHGNVAGLRNWGQASEGRWQGFDKDLAEEVLVSRQIQEIAVMILLDAA